MPFLRPHFFTSPSGDYAGSVILITVKFSGFANETEKETPNQTDRPEKNRLPRRKAKNKRVDMIWSR